MIVVKTWGHWSKILFLEGLFFLALSLGWSFGMHARLQSETLVIVLFVCGVVGLLAALTLTLGLQRIARSDKSAQTGRRPVDLAQCFRASHAFGEQAPLFEGQGLSTEILIVDSPRRVTVPARTRTLLIEHWEGSAVKVRGKTELYQLSEKQILRLSDAKNWDSLSFESLGGLLPSKLVLHFLSDPSGLE